MKTTITPGPLRDIRRIVFLGDSITQAANYVTDFECWLLSQGLQIEVITVGLGSETATDLTVAENAGHLNAHGFGRPFLSQRLDRILAGTRPDLVFACYGMNDGGALPPNEHGLNRFAAAIQSLHTTVSNTGVKEIVLCTPPIRDAKEDQILTEYSNWLLTQRDKGWTVVDIHGPMRKALDDRRRQDPAFKFADDGVHPGRAGHWLMAREIVTQFAGAKLEGVSSAEELLGPNGAGIRALVHERMELRFNAWMTTITHTRPGVTGGPDMPAGPSLAQAAEKSALISTQISALMTNP